MKYGGVLLAVTDMEKSRQFYCEKLGRRVISDFGANISLEGGIFLQTMDSWRDFIGGKEIEFRGNDAELYFEEDDIDGFLATLSGVDFVHLLLEHPWGQRAVRFYDPDGHIIEVGENLVMVVKRFIDDGMTEAEVAVRMDVQEEYIHELLCEG